MSDNRASTDPSASNRIPDDFLKQKVFETCERLQSNWTAVSEKPAGDPSTHVSPAMHRKLLAELNLAGPDSSIADSCEIHLWQETGGGAERFEIVRPLASGGMGLVSEAIDREFDRRVALKEILPAGANDPAYRMRFQTEAEITARLDHPGIVPVYCRGRLTDGRLFYTMRLIAGEQTGTLKQAIEAFHTATPTPPSPGGRDLAWRGLIRRVIDVCNTMAYAHREGVLHRDLKPSNILLGSAGETLVVDWGLARFVHEAPVTGVGGLWTGSTDPQTTQLTVGVGTIGHAAPEQLQGDGMLASTSSDIYSLGTILYAVLTGRNPFPSRKELELEELMGRVRSGDFLPPRVVNPTIDPALEAICLKAMDRDPSQRYRQASELATDLERALADEPIAAWREPWSRSVRRWSGRHRTLLTAGTVSLTLLSLGLGALTLVQAKNRIALTREGDRLREAVAQATRERARAEELRQLAEDQTQIAEEQRENARTGEQLAINAVDQFRLLVSGSWQLSTRPEMTPLRNALLNSPMEFYRELRNRLLKEDEPSLEHLARLRDATRDLASVQLQMGDLGEAQQLYESVLALCDKALEDRSLDPAETFDWQYARASSHHTMGFALKMADNDLAHQLTEFTLAVDSLQELFKNSPTNFQVLSELAGSHFGLGHTLSSLNRLPEARTHFETAIRLQQQLIEQQPNGPQHRRQLADILVNSSLVLNRLDDSAAASEQMQRADAIFGELGDNHPDNPDFRHRQTANRFNTGLALKSEGKQQEALEAFQDAVESWHRLVQEFPQRNQFQYGLRLALRALMTQLQQQNQPAQALPYIRQLVELARPNAMKNTALVETRGQFLEDFHILGHVLQQAGQLPEALAVFRDAQPLATSLLEEQPGERRWIYQDIELRIHNSAYAIDPADLRAAVDRLEVRRDLARDLSEQPEASASDRQVYRNLLSVIATLQERLGDNPQSDSTWQAFRESEERDPKAHPLIARLREVGAGAEPNDRNERLDLARASLRRHDFQLAARLYATALQIDPALAADRQARHCYQAAQAALRTAAAFSDPAAEPARAHRAQALRWLREELQGWREVAQTNPATGFAGVVEWRTDPAFASVRAPDRRDLLPPDEQSAWEEFFAQVDQFLRSAQ
ncbi:MAG: protein kinase domain-containing protein [Planctomycetaceae bacterium]